MADLVTTTSAPALAHTQLTGAAGEAMAQVHLLMRGWIAGNMNASVRNNAGFDLIAAKRNRKITIAVKTIGHRQHNLHWSVPANIPCVPTTLFRGETRPDFLMVVWFDGGVQAPTQHRVFLIPSSVADYDVLAAYKDYLKHPNKNGAPRHPTGHISIGFSGKNNATNITNEFAVKWQCYENNWAALEMT